MAFLKRNRGALCFVLLLAACADKSNAADASVGTGGRNGSGGSGVMNHDAGTGGVGASQGATGGTGAGGASASGGGAGGVGGSGGTAEHDAGGGGTGGRGATDAGADASASAGKSCDDLAMMYAAAIEAAKMCNAQASAQCQQVVPAGPSCRRCTTHVNDATALDAIRKQYDAAGCPNDPCMGVLCVNPGNGDCVPIDRGDVCQ